MSGQLCIVPCGKAKIWDKHPSAGPTPARDVYTGSFASLCRRYASTFFEDWVILSAKHGFLLPNDLVPGPYNVSFSKPGNKTISTDALREQAERKDLLKYSEITVVGGKAYNDRAQAVFRNHKLAFPLDGCRGIGQMNARLKRALTEGTLLSAGSEPRSMTHPMNARQASHIQKYMPLNVYLTELARDEVTLTTNEIERILGFTLPASAFRHSAWRTNTPTHSQARAWMDAGWTMVGHSAQAVTFKRAHLSHR